MKGLGGPKQAQMPQSFFNNTLRNLLVSTLRLYRNPAKTSERITRPYGNFPKTTSMSSKNHLAIKNLNQIKEPHHTMAI